MAETIAVFGASPSEKYVADGSILPNIHPLLAKRGKHTLSIHTNLGNF
jgi:hypothetical protein